jgi:hypothetical protein
MKVSAVKTLKEYDKYCQNKLVKKIPNLRTKDWRLCMGDCIYDYSDEIGPSIRKSVHNESDQERDLSGLNALLSNHFYYFGEKAQPLPNELRQLIKRYRGHKKIKNQELIKKFEKWISRFKKNKVYADPQMASLFKGYVPDQIILNCARQHFEEDGDETEDLLC